MAYDPWKHHRHSIRLKGYDYTRPGAYFVTIVTKNREYLFGDVVAGVMKPNDAGCIIETVWHELPARFPIVELDAFIVMPNHIHGIIILSDPADPVGAGLPRPGSPRPTARAPRPGEWARIVRAGYPRPRARIPRPYIGQIVAFNKYQTTKRINQIRGTPGAPVWQRNYWDHIVRNDDELSRIREYIQNNPGAWKMDDENTDRRRSR
jgi:REP element-mobilizing transposase RayT